MRGVRERGEGDKVREGKEIERRKDGWREGGRMEGREALT